VSDIFVSYASEDRERIRPLVELLESRGWSVWWDRKIHAGPRFDQIIEEAIEQATCIIAVWSRHSVVSDWVRTEASEGLDRGILVPMRIDDVRPPLEFRRSQTAELLGFPEHRDGLDALLAGVRDTINKQGRAGSEDDETDAGEHDERGESTSFGLRPKLIGVLVVAVVGVASWIGWAGFRTESARDTSQYEVDSQVAAADQIQIPSIAILPFVDLSEQGDQEYFANGISEEILDVLTRTPNLRVVGRTSSFQFKGYDRDLREIGKTLSAGYLLEGSVRQDGDRVRVGVQLVDASTGFNVWSDRFDHELKHIFEIQESIAEAVGTALKVQVATDVSPRRDLAAYTLYLRGLYAWRLRMVEGEKGAISLLEQATTRDPEFTEAHATLAAAWQLRALFAQRAESSETESLRARAITSAERALQLEPGQPMALTALSGVYAHTGRLVEARELLDLALKDPRASESPYVFLSSILRMVGNQEAGIELIRKGLENNPHSQSLHRELSQLGFETRNLEMAVEHGRLAVEISQYKEPVSAIFTAAALAEQGDVAAALELIDRVPIPPALIDPQGFRLALQAHSSAEARVRFIEFARVDGSLPWAMALRRLDEVSLADRLLIQIAQDGVFERVPLALSRVFEHSPTGFRRTEIFEKTVRELGVYEYWRRFGWPSVCEPVSDKTFTCD